MKKNKTPNMTYSKTICFFLLLLWKNKNRKFWKQTKICKFLSTQERKTHNYKKVFFFKPPKKKIYMYVKSFFALVWKNPGYRELILEFNTKQHACQQICCKDKGCLIFVLESDSTFRIDGKRNLEKKRQKSRQIIEFKGYYTCLFIYEKCHSRHSIHFLLSQF